MIRRLLIPLLGSGLLLAATAGSAFAKCEQPNPPEFCSQVIASFNASVAGMRGETARTVTLMISQGEQPFEATDVVLTFTSVRDGSVVSVPATLTAQPGIWHAEVTLPDGGTWTAYAQVVANTGAEYRLYIDRVQVADPPAPPVGTPLSPPPVAPSPPILPIALILAGLAAVALLGQATWTRSRRRSAAANASSASTATADRA